MIGFSRMSRHPTSVRSSVVLMTALLLNFLRPLAHLAPESASAGVDANPLPPVLDSDDRWGFNHVTPGLGASQLARNAGARWNRWEFRWETIQPAVGQFDWSESDRVVNESLAAGLAVQGVLIGLPNWALDPANGLPQGLYLAWDAQGSQWAQFVRELVSRYRGK